MDPNDWTKQPELDAETVAANSRKSANDVLPVLLARAGGSVTVTRQEWDDVVARYGGVSQMAMRMEWIKHPDEKKSGVRLTLVRKPPKQGDLPA